MAGFLKKLYNIKKFDPCLPSQTAQNIIRIRISNKGGITIKKILYTDLERLKFRVDLIKDPDERYELEERIGILQYDGGHSEEFAIYLALQMRIREKNHPDLVKLGYYPPDFFDEAIYWQKKTKR